MGRRADKNLKNCQTCDLWAGSRTIHPSRIYVDVESADVKGECCGGGFNRMQTTANQNCGKWNKWGPLK